MQSSYARDSSHLLELLEKETFFYKELYGKSNFYTYSTAIVAFNISAGEHIMLRFPRVCLY